VRRTLVLVGLPGSGKSTVGALAAADLGVPFVDLDTEIERESGKTVPRIFAEDGEPAFRALEATLGARYLEGPPCVLAPGGGFVLEAGNRQRLVSALVVYLQVSPSEAARRLGPAPDRPLLVGYVPALRLRQLLERRESLYLQLGQPVATDDRTPQAVADQVVKLAREDGAH
jgi:shikimate kinase